ncbi:MAG: extracellular solute-binding protein [Betaproteobacteria bacterium]|nr:extracellular solute-binding protein [Betaproteobacteria bacterium]
MDRQHAFGRRRFLRAGAIGTAAAALPVLGAETADAKPNVLTVRVWGGNWRSAIETGVSRGFTARTGIAIRYDESDERELLARLATAAKQKQAPSVHVCWTTSNTATRVALRGNAEELAGLTNLDRLLAIAKPEGFDTWPYVNAYSYTYVLAYRPKAFPKVRPASWKALLDPGVRGRVALYHDGIGLYAAAQVAGGGKIADIPKNMKACWEFVSKLHDQRPLFGEDPDLRSWFERGEVDLACMLLPSARRARLEGLPISWVVPVEGAKLDTDALWIPRGWPARDVYWARQYVNHALSTEAQQAWCGHLGLPGVNPLVRAPDDMVGDPAYPTRDADFRRLLRIPNTIQVENEKDWVEKFRDVMQG